MNISFTKQEIAMLKTAGDELAYRVFNDGSLEGEYYQSVSPETKYESGELPSRQELQKSMEITVGILQFMSPQFPAEVKGIRDKFQLNDPYDYLMDWENQSRVRDLMIIRCIERLHELKKENQ